jgi:HAE1 family hydrophobic/amphiphilic exporter-1
MVVAFSSMFFAIMLAAFLVYIVMASLFESLLHPFVIMFTIPFALAGVVIALYITSKPISVIVLIGVVMLAGIVVNNAIVLIDCINTRIKEGMPRREAIIEGGKIRLRPILMTTTTTVLGLLPLALGLGEGAELRMPMGITVIGGLLFSTFLTLILVPVVYDIAERIKDSVWKVT